MTKIFFLKSRLINQEKKEQQKGANTKCKQPNKKQTKENTPKITSNYLQSPKIKKHPDEPTRQSLNLPIEGPRH